MTEFTEAMRYDYPLTENGFIVDVGAYHGNWIRQMAAKYNCSGFGFEPVFVEESKRAQSEKVVVFPAALGAYNREEHWRVRGDSTGRFVYDVGLVEKLVSILPVSHLYPGKTVDVIKLNCEGMEYEILDQIIRDKMTSHFVNFQIQFHRVLGHNDEAHRNEIRDQLKNTHELVADCPFVWELWRRR